MDGYCGGGAQEPGKSTNVVDFLYFGEQVVALMFGLFSFLATRPAAKETLKIIKILKFLWVEMLSAHSAKNIHFRPNEY